MREAEFLDEVSKEFSFLEMAGFRRRIVDRNAWFEKQTATEGFRISFSFTEYDKIHVSGLQAAKRFDDVARAVKSLGPGELLDDYTISVGPAESAIPRGLSVVSAGNNFHFEIGTASAMGLFARFVQAFYEQTALPFFDRYSSVAVVDAHLSTMADEAVSRFVNPGNNRTFCREYAIKRIAKNKAADTYYDRVMDELNSLRGDPLIDDLIQSLSETKQRLDGNS